ncbi:hypothetical protein CR513_23317, partial [Mucuna pruriens]
MGGISAQSECGGEVSSILTTFKSFVQKQGSEIPPSKECCEIVKNVDAPCFCKYVTLKLSLAMLVVGTIIAVEKVEVMTSLLFNGECGRYIQNGGAMIPPSQVIQNVDVPCLCQNVNPFVELFISMEKAVYVMRYCGIPIAPGTQCGKGNGNIRDVRIQPPFLRVCIQHDFV